MINGYDDDNNGYDDDDNLSTQRDQLRLHIWPTWWSWLTLYLDDDDDDDDDGWSTYMVTTAY